MERTQKRLVIANTFGSFGYISVLFQWLWTFLILAYPLLSSRPDFLFLPSSEPTFTHDTTPAPASPFLVIIAIAATIAILGVTVVAVARLPKNVGKKGATLTRNTTAAVLPAITHHKKLTKKKRVQLSYRIVLVIKLLLVTLPLVALLFGQPLEKITPEVVWAMAFFCAACSISYFLVQHLLARFMRISNEKLW
ncbi:MAG: hypothetical protein WBP22_04905 [Candidatus Saccharimonas sp.]